MSADTALREATPQAADETTVSADGRLLRPQRSGDPVPPAIEEAPKAVAAVEMREQIYRRSLAAADMLAAGLAIALVAGVVAHQLRWATLLALPLVVLAGKIQGLYDRDELLLRKTTIDEAPKLFHLATLYTLAITLLGPHLFAGPLAAWQSILLWASLVTFAVTARRAARTICAMCSDPERCLFIGDAYGYDRLATKMEAARVNATLVGRLSLKRTARAGERSVDAADLRELLNWTRGERVIIDPAVLPGEEMLDLVRAAKALGVRVSLIPRVLDVVGSGVAFDDLQGLTLMGVPRFGLTRSSAFIKRSFDVAGALAILVVVGPLMAFMALAIKLDSRGPVFFRQTRVGRDGRHFRIFKFRTMVNDAEALKTELRHLNEARDGLFKITADPRITRIGGFLRRTSLDELPQLFNVLSGQMSLVGPRPLVVDEDANIEGWHRRRLALTPGMTGHWQIAGSARVPLHEMVKIDYLYVAGWSLWADFKILLRTVPYVLARRGL